MQENASSARIRILCVDDHPLILTGIQAMVNTEPDMQVVGQAYTAEDGLQLFFALQPDVVLMDLRLSSPMSGVDAIRRICSSHSKARVIALTTYKGDEDIHHALEAGATAYVLKDKMSLDLLHFIREVHAGRRPISKDVALRLAEYTPRVAVTEREREVLQLMASGKRNKEIAAELGITEETVKFHVKSILAKLRVSDRTHAVTTALQRGIIHLQ